MSDDRLEIAMAGAWIHNSTPDVLVTEILRLRAEVQRLNADAITDAEAAHARITRLHDSNQVLVGLMRELHEAALRYWRATVPTTPEASSAASRLQAALHKIKP